MNMSAVEPLWPSPLEDQLRFLGYDKACEESTETLWASVSAKPADQDWPDVRQIPFAPGVEGFYAGLKAVRLAVDFFESRGFERISIMEALFSKRPEKLSQTGSWRANGPVQGGMPVFALDVDALESHAGLAARMDEKGELPLPSLVEAEAILSALEALPGAAVVRTGSGGGQVLLRGKSWSELRAMQTAMLIEEALGVSIDRGPITMHGPLRVWGTERFKDGLRGRIVDAVVSDGELDVSQAVPAIARAIQVAAVDCEKSVPDWSEVVPRMNARLEAQKRKAEESRAAWRARQSAVESDEARPGDRLNASVDIVEALEAWGCAVSVSGRSFRIARGNGRWPSDTDGALLDTGVAYFHSPSGASAAGVEDGVCTPFGLLIQACEGDASLAARAIVACEKDGAIGSVLSWLDSSAEDISKAFPKQVRRTRPRVDVLTMTEPGASQTVADLGPLIP